MYGSTNRSRRVLLPVMLCLALVATLLAPASPASAATCPCSIWPATAVPGTPAASDTAAVEVGVKFRADSDGFVTGVRFYKGSGNSGTHIGHLWSADGTNLGTVTFTGESATGWQTATFASPIPISADTTYVASYYAPNGRYGYDEGAFADAGVDNEPLHALRDGADGANGVYRYGTGGGFPTNSWQASNYWVDVVYTTSAADTTAPTVTGTSPAAGATGVLATTAVSATLSEAVQAGTAAVAVTASAGAVAGATAYDAATRTVTFSPASALAASTAYTATVSGARDTAGNTMNPFPWSFTTAAAGGSGCPCTIWPATAAPATASVNDDSAVEVGVRFRTSTAGYISGLRFYKGASNTGTHTGSLWTNTGTRLATVTFTGESGSGWQAATLPSPVAVAANTTYVASYHTDAGFYSLTGNGLASAVSRGPLTALANGANGANGVYRYGASAFPTNSYQASNYWVDVVFDTTATDATAPTIAARAPGPGAVGVPATGAVSVTFSEPVTASSVVMTLTGPSGVVAGTTGYDAGSSTVTFTPAAALATSTGYTVAVSGARDAAGNVMAPATWSFTTAAPPPPPPPDQGPGGPVLVVKSAVTGASGFTSFLAEVLRTEGINEFATADLPSVTASVLGQYDVVLLGPTPLTAAEVGMLTTWVNGGGNLVAFRPDKQLAGLLGLTSTAGTLAEGYLKVDVSASPGAGITDQTIQYHGTADRYTLAGARAVATLYSSASVATANPAVSLAEVGASGGQAAAFSFDLAQSLVYTRQGNPAWEKQERDGSSPIRSGDLYFGGSSSDWVDLDKVAIPQADEQQRLLANLIGAMNLDRKPLPRFWYFPRSLKAVIVATGDDHATGGTAGRFDQYTANSSAGCVVDDWQCPRFTSYVFSNTPLSDTQASAYQSRGFEVGLHVSTNCGDFTSGSLATIYTDQLAAFRAKYGNVAAPGTNRTHCLVWSDWSTQASTEAANGIRLDTNYYYWPGTWIDDRPGFMTGSGMPMRFSGETGGLIDAYQAATQMTDESGQSYPFTPDALLDAALGPEGRYGAFTVNMHTDEATTYDSDQVLASAQSRGVPVVSARQMLTWLDGRNASSYTGISWSADTLSFTVNVGSGANGLTGMVPTLGPAGRTLSTLTRAGTAVPFTRTTIKGVEYAMFTAAPGEYAAEYSVSAAAPTVEAATLVADSSTASVTVTGSLAGRTEIEFGTQADELTGRVVDGTRAGKRTVRLGGLASGTAYWYRVRVTAPGGRTTVSKVQQFVTPATDRRAAGVSAVSVLPRPDGTVSVGWRTDESAAATLLIGATPEALDEWQGDRGGRRHSVVVTRLAPQKTYHYRVRSVDAAGNTTVWPALGRPPATFVSAASGVADFTGPQLRTGTAQRTTVTDGGVRLSSGARTGSQLSRVLDAGQMVTWDRLTYQAEVPAGAALRLFVRTGSTAAPDATWTDWTRVGQGGRVSAGSRYAQYRVELTRSRGGSSPVLSGVGITSDAAPMETPGEG
ncbi:hypothetical protein DMB66_32715 [Actinoplanes sp. ATCC 53533]|uniref:DUF4082 domain-containing protein n=1 Tax=Actinoplanes sp. ATCC 53533 TaxID=1288362 RepID=UPI000F77BB10|nr:DUF4082 domain-containing protein [Actinoplanes sp. ATCC 53533]RSM56838.1 hypothetical protein DMB66_32715 [Actinoplanes sp. ATCC 53533]